MSHFQPLSLKRADPIWSPYMADVPEAVTAALAGRGTAYLQEADRPLLATPISEGDLRIIEPLPHSQADRRIGLVQRVHLADGFAEVLLVHTAPEMATDRDLILTPDAASTPYSAVVQTDLRGAVWIPQFGKQVGRLSGQAITDLRAVCDTPDALALETACVDTGIPLAGPLDPRWRFKGSEGAALRALAADCTEAHLADSSTQSPQSPNSFGLAQLRHPL